MTKRKEPAAKPVVEKVTFEAVIDADLFARAAKGRSNEETRYYLKGVNVEPCKAGGGALLVATNGSILVAIRDADALVKGSGIVRLDAPLLAVAGRKAKAEFRRVTPPRRYIVVRGYNTGKSRAFVVDQDTIFTEDERAIIDPAATRKAALAVLDEPDRRVVASQFYAAIIDGPFPDWRRVLPPSGEPKPGYWRFDAGLMGTIAAALCDPKSSMSSRSLGLRILVTDNLSAAVVQSSGMTIDGFALIMPMRDDGSRPPAVADWARRPEPAA
jgi:hypothetical protein